MATINDISSLKIKGANFQDETILELFKKKISLIYGENGAGKSTIARGIYNWAHQDDTHEINAAFLDSNKNEVHIDEASTHAFVFDEDYIQRMVGIKSSTGLNTIVILGDLKDVEEKISEKKLLLDKENLAWQLEKSKLDKLIDSQNRESQLFIQNCIRQKLKKDGGWADRLSKIRNNKTKSKVNDKVIDVISSSQKFLQDMPEDTKLEERHAWINGWLCKQMEIFNNDLKLYQNTSQNAFPISEKICLEQNSFDEAAFINALAEVVEKPEITERDELILSITATLQAKGADFIKDVKNEFEREEVDRCPYCQQIVDSQRKKNLLKALGKVLEAQTKNHVSYQLKQFRINDIQLVEWTKFEALNKSDLVENGCVKSFV